MKPYVWVASILAALGGAWWLHAHLVQQGVEQQRAADAKAYAALQRKADEETGRLKNRAEAAEKAHVEEHDENARYRAEHPVSGGLCQRPGMPAAARSQTSSAQPVDARASAAGGDLQPVLSGTTESGGQRDPNVRGMLDALFARCEAVSAELREYQARGE